jgi:signal transduction histidine kinase
MSGRTDKRNKASAPKGDAGGAAGKPRSVSRTSATVPQGDTNDDFWALRNSELLEANERLILAALDSQAQAENIASQLEAMTRSSQRDALTDTPSRALMLDRITHAAAMPELDPIPSISELREANEELVLAALSAQELQAAAELALRRELGSLATLAHELRNPLAPILVAASLLNRIRAQDPMLPRIQGVIERQAIHMARLVDDLLDKSRLITGRFRLDRCRVELASTLEQAVETCRPAMDVRHQQIDLRLPRQALSVHGDRTRLVQIFVNLLHNACKYTPENGMISIGATIRSNEIEISVSDNGIGITADALPHIFELFVQDARGLTLSNDGLGIGLAVVRELVQAHGGNVTASSPGSDSGSTFVVTLPLLGEEPAA